jgi:hypothetical protein
MMGRVHRNQYAEIQLRLAAMNSLQIEVGKYYTTRDGRKVRIYAVDGRGSQPVHGAILREDGWQTNLFNSNGGYFRDSTNPHSSDIIAPWIEKPKVNWTTMPAWAKWVALDANGRWFYYIDKPNTRQSIWDPNSSQCNNIPAEYYPTFTGNWEDSLVERPVV